MSQHRNAAQSGVSMVETAITMAVVATTLSATLPGFDTLQQRRRLDGATAQLESELQFARSLAVERQQAVRFTFEPTANGMCYVIHTGGSSACHCAGSGVPVCQDGVQVFRSVAYTPGDRLSVSSGTRSFAFDPTMGTVTPTATLELRNPRGDALRLIINIMGRIRSCSPTSQYPGHRAC